MHVFVILLPWFLGSRFAPVGLAFGLRFTKFRFVFEFNSLIFFSFNFTASLVLNKSSLVRTGKFNYKDGVIILLLPIFNTDFNQKNLKKGFTRYKLSLKKVHTAVAKSTRFETLMDSYLVPALSVNCR